jgi:hypothetical protein
LVAVDGKAHIKLVKNKNLLIFRADFCLAGATGIAPSASNFGGTDFQVRLGLERLLKRAFMRDFCFLKGVSCLLRSFYNGLCKLARN